MISVLSRKGGVGKSTLAIHLSVAAQIAGHRTLLVDLDPQRTAASWWRSRAADTPQLVETDPINLQIVIDAAKTDGVEIVVVDTRPSVEADAIHAATVADLVLVPTRPAVHDLRAILATLDIVKGTARRSLIVLNACPPSRGVGEASIAVDARHALAAFGVRVAPVAITNRAAFPAAAIAGLTAIETEPDGKAAKEMRALWRTVEKELSDEKAHTTKRAGTKGGPARPARAVARTAAS